MKKGPITERQSKSQYGILPNGCILGWSAKCASTLLFDHFGRKAVSRMGQKDAITYRAKYNNVFDIVLIVRHPLDRLVSNYVFWRTVKKDYIRKVFLQRDGDAPDEQPVEVEGEFEDLTIEEWYALTQRKYNRHWTDQSVYHTYAGKFIPNVVYPIEVLPTITDKVVNDSPRTGTWEDYFTPEFRAEMELRYYDDLTLYEDALEAWDGKKPRYF